MIGNYSARLSGSKRNLLALLASSVLFSAGCANMMSTAPDVNSLSSPATLSGMIHGGNQPVVGATVTLWFAGQGAPAVKAATTTSDATGSFAFTQDTLGGHDGTTPLYSCPTTGGSPLVYAIAKGGNTQNNGTPGQTNTAAAFIALYGSCTPAIASNFVMMSEVTTVATMAAVQQFFSPIADTNGNADTLRADSTGQQRLVVLNLPNTVNLLANAATGLAVGSTSVPAASGGSIAPAVTLTATPETAKINTLANIISSCINGATSTAAACGTLFTAAASPAGNITNLNPSVPFPTAADTLQALYYIFTNPTNGNTTNKTNLFGLQPATGAPYAPFLAGAPTDWTVGVSYASTSSCGTPTGGTGGFISSPTDINIDGADNIWFGNGQIGGNLSSISAAGAPLYCVNFEAGASSTGGTLDSFTPSAGTFTPNVWFAGAATMYRYNPVTKAMLAFPVTGTPLGITADGVGNVYFSTTTGSLFELPGAASASVAVAPVQISNNVGANPIRLMPDYQNTTAGVPNPVNIWVSSGSTFISQVKPSTAAGNLNGFITTQLPTSGSSYGLAVGRGGIFASGVDTGAISQLVNNGTTYPSAGGYPLSGSTVTAAGISSPKGIALDGRSNVWIPNSTNGSGTGSVSQVSVFGGALSPSTGFQKASAFLNSNSASVVDQAGNVWVIGAGNTFITEIVGQGVPIYAPYAVGLNNGRFQTIP
jgi:hypothetical protein